MTAREAALDLIKRYVDRGDTIEQLKAGHMGYASSEYWAQIGGYMPVGKGGKLYSADWILVTKLNKKLIQKSYKLQEIFDEIKQGQLTLV